MDARWPRSTADSPVPAVLKAEPEDFRVRELLPFVPSGEGEHLFLQLEKTGLGTPELARMLADAHGIDHVDVGYAGMKDKQAVTSQWFSLRGVQSLDETVAELCNVQILQQTRHQQKLRRGQLDGNAFRILLRETDMEGANSALEALAAGGAPNYFGAQRFGRDNLEKAAAWLRQRRRRRVSRFKQGLYLSVLRSYLFNEVLAARVGAGSWNGLLPGDSADRHGRPTGPLWGRGRSAAGDAAADIEQAVLKPHAELLEGLEHAGLTQARRSLLAKPEGLEWRAVADGLQLEFVLGPGQYATSLLADRFLLRGSGP